MGSDPRRLHGLRPDEHLVALALERATGATAQAHDVDGRQGAYDLLLTWADGRTAAVEVTTHAGDGARRRDGRTGRPAWPDPRRPWWTVTGRPAGAAHLTTLPAAVTTLLAEPAVARRAAKVASVAGTSERHLVVEVGEGGLPDPLYAALSAPDARLPDADPVVPDGLTHVWLTTAWHGSPLVGWSRTTGWTAHDVTSRHRQA
ncbi:MAG TPA: hypothetical protein VF140_03625 [Phycicoccus sp.]